MYCQRKSVDRQGIAGVSAYWMEGVTMEGLDSLNMQGLGATGTFLLLLAKLYFDHRKGRDDAPKKELMHEGLNSIMDQQLLMRTTLLELKEHFATVHERLEALEAGQKTIQVDVGRIIISCPCDTECRSG